MATNTSKKEKKKKKNPLGMIRDSVLIFLNLLVGILLLICAKVSAISPSDLIFSSYPNYLLPVMTVLNLLFFLYWLSRLKLWGILSLSLFLITLPNIKTWFPITLSQQEHSMGKEIKVLTYNTMQFSSYVPHSSKRPNPVIHYIQECNADIVCLQEAGYKESDEYITKKVILKELKQYPYHAYIKIVPTDPKSTNIWTFSKYPIKEYQRIYNESTTNGSFYCDIDIKGDIVRVVNNHLESNKLTLEDKSLYQEIIHQPDKNKITEVAIKLSQKLTPAAVNRAKQAKKVADCIKKSPYPVIACGDFNDIPNSYTYRTVKGNLIDAWENNCVGPGITFHEKFYLFRIDYIMHSPQLTSYDTHIDKVPFSDHYPLWSYIQLP